MILLRNVSANLGTHNPSGQHFVAADRAGIAGWHGSLCPHTLPPLWPPPLHSIWVIHTRFVMAFGLQYASEGRPVQQTELQIPRCNWQANRWMVAAWSPQALASLPAFFSFSTPCLVTQSLAWLYRLNTHKKLLCLAIHLPNGALSHGANWL